MKRKTKIIYMVISVIEIIGGFFGFMCYKELWAIYHRNEYKILMIIYSIITISGIVSAIVTKYEPKKKSKKRIEEKNFKYKTSDNNSKQDEIEKQKGEHGERLVKILIGQTIAGEQYVINNLILANEDKTKSSQIDHVFINKHGIWCIETKDWGGMIFGKETDNTWTQVFKCGEEKYKHYNPIKQNETHIKYLNKALNYNKEIHNIIVFTNGDISNVQAENTYDVERLYYRLWKCNSNIELTKEEMEIIYNKLLQIKATQISDEQHVINVNSRIA